MKKAIIAILLATLAITACKKEDPAAWIDNTRWQYDDRQPDYQGYPRIIYCHLTLRNGGGLSIGDRYNGPATSWHTQYDYRVKTYKYEGGEQGTLTLEGTNGETIGTTATASFTLNFDKTRMYLSTPKGTYTLTRNR